MKNQKFSPGTYYIGDPCYAFQDGDWDQILFDTDFFTNDHCKYKGFPIFAASTAHGDGYYTDQFDNGYPVDAGLLGIMPIEICDFGDIDFENERWVDDRGITYADGTPFEFKPGNVVKFESEFNVTCENGKFTFGHIFIDTDPSNDVD